MVYVVHFTFMHVAQQSATKICAQGSGQHKEVTEVALLTGFALLFMLRSSYCTSYFTIKNYRNLPAHGQIYFVNY